MRARKSTTNQSVKEALMVHVIPRFFIRGASYDGLDWSEVWYTFFFFFFDINHFLHRLRKPISSLISRGEVTKDSSEFRLIMAWFMTQLPFNSPDRILVRCFDLQNVRSFSGMAFLSRHTSLELRSRAFCSAGEFNFL